MKKIFNLFVICSFLITNFAFSTDLKLKSGNYQLSKIESTKNLKQADYDKVSLYFLEVKNRDNLKKMKDQGIKFLNYMGNSIWLVKGTVSKFKIYSNSMLKFEPEMKISPVLKNKQVENKEVSVYLFNDKNKLFTKFLKDNKIKFKEIDGRIDCFVGNREQLNLIANQISVSYINDKEPKKIVNNEGAQEMSDVDSVQHAPYNLTGTGEIVGVWDGGEIFPHKEFEGRTTLKEHSSPADHATHVAGTIGSSGKFDSKSEGMATEVSIYSYDYNGNALSELVDANNFFGIQLSNHSWGWKHDVEDGWDVARFGDYESYSSNQDRICYENNLIMVRSAGNSRDEFEFTQTIDPTSTSKNPIVIGALYGENQMTDYSSWGPCDDGRVKPDICAKGGQWFPFNVDPLNKKMMYSTLPDDKYGKMQGTSMAAPVVTGSLALILETYHRYNQGEIPAAMAKGLILHTAEDLYNTGPDYMTGFGLLKVRDAVDFLIGSNYGENSGNTIIRSLVDNGETKTYEFTVPEGNLIDYKVTACWADVQGSPSATKALVNDVDIKVISPTGVEYFPYVLDKDNPTADATTGVNSLDNVEQVKFTPTESGTWTIEVKGTDIDSLNIPEVYVFVNAEVKLDKYSEPLVYSNLKNDVEYNKLNIIKGSADDIMTFDAHVFDDDGFIDKFSWNFSNITLNSETKNAGNFTLTNDVKVYGFDIDALDNDGNKGISNPTYILLEDKEGFEELPAEGLTDVSIAYGEVKKYYFTFPAGTTDAKITTTGTGDVDLFVSYLNGPSVSYNGTTGDYEFPYTNPLLLSSTSSTGEEEVNLNSPLKENGTWCIQVYGWENNPMTFSLSATYKDTSDNQEPDTEICLPKDNLTVLTNSTIRFKASGTDDLGIDNINWLKDSEDLGNGLTKKITFDKSGTFTIKAEAIDKLGLKDSTPAEVTVNVVELSDYPHSNFCPLVYEDNVYETEIYLLNTSDSVNSAVILAIDDFGSIVSSYKVTDLAQGEKRMFNIGTIFPGINFVTGLKIISNYKLDGFVRVKTKGIGDKQGSALFVKSYEKVIVPHIHEIKDTEHQWGTTFGLISEVNDTVNFDYFDDTLTNISSSYAPFSRKERFYSLFDKDMPNNQMWGILKSEKNQGIAGMEMFEKVDGNQQQTILSLSDETFTEMYLAHIDITAGWWTGLSLVNPNLEDANVTIEAFTNDGTKLTENTFTINAEDRYVNLIQGFFAEEISNTIAWVKITSNVGLTGYEIFGYENNEQITGINVIGTLSNKLTFLHVSKDSTPWTGIAVLNTTENQVNVTFTAYDESGNVLGDSVVLPINGKSKYVDLVKNLFKDVTGLSYIKAQSDTDNSICGFELFGTTSQTYLNGIEAVVEK